MEYLDIYDEDGNKIGKEDRKIVHQKGLWHKTIHCWLYDSQGNIYFQIRKDENKLYTTSSGHVSAGESVEEAFDREIHEELGIHTSKLNKEQIETVYFRMNRERNGEMFIDRAFASIFICKIDLDLNELDFDVNEVDGLAKVKAKEVFDLLRFEEGTIKGTLIHKKDNKVVEVSKEYSFDDFLINKGERGISKYGFLLERIMSKS
jgi:isopentenyldiphosphate isomerase